MQRANGWQTFPHGRSSGSRVGTKCPPTVRQRLATGLIMLAQCRAGAGIRGSASNRCHWRRPASAVHSGRTHVVCAARECVCEQWGGRATPVARRAHTATPTCTGAPRSAGARLGQRDSARPAGSLVRVSSPVRRPGPASAAMQTAPLVCVPVARLPRRLAPDACARPEQPAGGRARRRRVSSLASAS